jgi:predicted nucleotidyltransferase
MHTAEIIERLRAFGAADPRLLGLYLFGSRASGEERPDSDIDLGILFREPQTLDDQLTLEVRLQEALPGLGLDVVDLGKASAFLALSVIRGERIYCADEYACDNFDLYVLRRAGDLAPFERQRRKLALAV